MMRRANRKTSGEMLRLEARPGHVGSASAHHPESNSGVLKHTLCAIVLLSMVLFTKRALADAAIDPDRAVVIDLHRPWLDGANWDQNTPPAVYGVDATLDAPRFTVVDANAQSLWVDRFALPVDVAKYPIISIKYRAQNASKDAAYLLRLVTEKDGNRNRVDVFKGSDLVADGQEHELKQDLRELNADGSLTTFGIGLKTDAAPATIDLLEVKFSAEGASDKLKDDAPITIHVTDQADAPIVGAKVIVDAERANFARSGVTDNSGSITIAPLANEVSKHMVRVEKEGMLTVEVPNAATESGPGAGD